MFIVLSLILCACGLLWLWLVIDDGYTYLLMVMGALAGAVLGAASEMIFLLLGGAVLFFLFADRGDLLDLLARYLGAWVVFCAVLGGCLGYATGAKTRDKSARRKLMMPGLFLAAPLPAVLLGAWVYSRHFFGFGRREALLGATAQAQQRPAPTPAVGTAVAVLPEASPEARVEENRQAALRHWMAGIKYYQGGNLLKAKDEWEQCAMLDPKNSDCASGLRRIDDLARGVK